MSKVRIVKYEEKHSQLIESGIDNLCMALYNETEEEKASILFCLDKYLDPYYGYNLEYESDIITLLQKILFEDNSEDIKADILDLLVYSKEPLTILEENIDKLSGNLLADAKYILNLKWANSEITYAKHRSRNLNSLFSNKES